MLFLLLFILSFTLLGLSIGVQRVEAILVIASAVAIIAIITMIVTSATLTIF